MLFRSMQMVVRDVDMVEYCAKIEAELKKFRKNSKKTVSPEVAAELKAKNASLEGLKKEYEK